MSKKSLEISAFNLAKEKELKGDDYFAYKQLEDITIAVVCDGVGSARAGAKAAQRTVEFLINSLKNRPLSWSMEKSILHFIENINRILYMESLQEYESVEYVTTLALAVIEGNRLYGANVGDSRIYLKRDGNLTQLSNDHSISEENMEHILTAAIGLEESVTPYYFENNLNVGDKLLLCSDGLYNELSKDELNEGIEINASFLVKKASKKHNDLLPDDTTAIVIKVKELDPRLHYKQKDLQIQESYKKGEEIDGYKLLKPLAPHKRVWLCSKRGQNYVIKFAPAEAIDDPKLLDLFVKEVWNAKRLKAGFFVKAVVPNNRTHRYYIMQYIDGVNLKEKIKKRPISVDSGIELAKYTLKMSQYLIRQDLVHGDIKPENIIIYERKGKEAFKFIDFGSITEAYSEVSRAGTPSYLAPERFSGEPITEQSEIFAIGVTLYEALTGKLPYGEIEPFQTPNFKTAKRPSSLNPKVPKWLDSIIMKAIEIDPKRRYTHYSNMLYELNNPQKVVPYFAKEETLFSKNPLKVCRIALIISLFANLALLLFK